ncbi:WG repeat-containing protein [Alistipes sp. OttesenSCG-928-L06]|nr:WG repeat-containing protein [Alistipes sp. OttesenSCG-928-L06]
MKSPTINNYLETVSNPAGRFKSLSGVEILRDAHGLPRYAVRSKTLDIAISHRGKTQVMCCPLHHDEAFDLRAYVSERYAVREARILLNEMLVFNDRNENGWHDVLLAEAAPDALDAKKPIPAYETPASTVPQFCEGLAVIEKEGKFGFADRAGCTVIACRYDWADAFDEGLAVVKQGELFGLVDKQGNEVFSPVHEDIRWRSDNGVVLVCREGEWTLKGRRGEDITENTFDFIFDFSEGLASVRRGGKYGYIDRSGTVAIPLIYDEAYSFSEQGLATVVKNGITFCIDTEGMVFD